MGRWGNGKARDRRVRVRKVKEGKVRDGKARVGMVRKGKARVWKEMDGRVRVVKVRDGRVRVVKVRDGRVRVERVNDGKMRDGIVQFGRVNDVKVRDGRVRDVRVKDGKVRDGRVRVWRVKGVNVRVWVGRMKDVKDETACQTWLKRQANLESLGKAGNSCQPNAPRRLAPPLDITSLPGYDKLNSREKELCSHLRLVPCAYIDFKVALISECEKHGGLRLAQARQLIKIDINKTRKIYDLLVSQGSIKRDPT